MPRPPVPSAKVLDKALDKLNKTILDLKYRLGVPVQDIRPDWSVGRIREMLNVINSDPTGRLSAQIKQAMLQGGLQW